MQLTRKSANAAELKIEIKRGMVDIGDISGCSIKGSEKNDFFKKYPILNAASKKGV